MKCILCGLVLAFVASAFAQQPSANQPPYTTPPTFPESQAPQQGMPPDTKAPPPQGLSTDQIEQQIQRKLDGEPALTNTKVSVKVGDRSVVLTGRVDTQEQHDLALRIAQSYAGDRKILDKIKVTRQA